MEKFYVTTAIDYVNAAPHIGHAYEKIAADIVARYQRLRGKEVFFLTGVDEHGSKVEKTAQAAGKTPQVFCDEMSEKFQIAWSSLLISNDYFIRTTEERHKKVVQEVFRRMTEKGDVYKGKYSGLYCEGCEDHLRERDLDESGNCPNHKRPPRIFEEENYFFRLSGYKEALRKWLTEDSGVVRPEGRRKEVLNQLDDEEFGDFSISRDRNSLKWGIPVPGDPQQVIYVWIDALTNYITGAGFLTDETLFKRFWPADLHLLGKDITKFHAIYWPAILMSLDLPLPRLVFGHGFITVEGQKMSKTLGNVMDPLYLVEQYGADAIRYFLFASNSFDQDGDFSRHEFISLVNSHLANSLGNLLNRTLSLIERNAGGKVPGGMVNQASLSLARQAEVDYCRLMDELEFAKAIESAFALVNEANRYLNEQKPWTQFKEGKLEEGGSVLLTALELLKQAAVLLLPVTPGLSARILEQLGFTGPFDGLTFKDVLFQETIPSGQPIVNRGPVFQRIDETESAATTV